MLDRMSRRMFVAGLVTTTLASAAARAGTTAYRYDAAGRLVAVLNSNGLLTGYEYDDAGNRTATKTPYVGPNIGANCFDAQFYLYMNPDVASAGVDPLYHFNSIGWVERRNPNSFFNTAGYLAAYPDIAAAGVNPLSHYVNNGAAENRDPSGQFDTQLYRSANGLSAGTNPLYHYLTTGYAQGLSPQGDGTYRFGV